MNDVIKHLSDERVKRNLSIMMTVKRAARDLLFDNGFEEIDTPILMPRTCEHYNQTFDILLENNAVMLADSPQIFKMLLSKAGYEKTFRFAHCFRGIAGENNPHTRLSEFVQLDLELRDTDLNEMIRLAESLVENICKKLNKIVKTIHIQGLECRSKFGAEMSPDLRENGDEISVVIVKNMPLTNDGRTPCHHIFALPSDPVLRNIYEDTTTLTTESFDIIMNGIEIGGGDMRVNDRALQTELMRIFNVDERLYAGYLETLERNDHTRRGGFAIGLERMVTALSGDENIRYAAAFPEYYKRGVN